MSKFCTYRPVAAALAVTIWSASAAAQSVPATPDASIKTLVGRLDLEHFRATIKGLTLFGDRREGSDRNRAANDWIEAQLKSYGCSDVTRLAYDFQPAPPPADAFPPKGSDRGAGGARLRGLRAPIGINNDLAKQPDAKLRALNSQVGPPGARDQVYCTKVGTTRPDEMYIVSAHMDGQGGGEAANDDGSGTALVMELARVLNAPDVRTDRSIRFILWNNEETFYNGSRAYIAQRAALQGKEDSKGSGRYPEPKWLGIVQHDMVLFDHGMPRADGTVSPEQRPEADVNVEFQVNSKLAAQSQALAWALAAANETYATDYSASVGMHMATTDSVPFQDLIPAISVRDSERGSQVGAGWNPHWHQPTDVFATYSDKDFRLGLNAAQTTLGAIGHLSGARIAK